MLLAADIGNSYIKLGVFDNDKLVWRGSVPTNSLAAEGLPEFSGEIDSAIASSVVPNANEHFSKAVRDALGIESVFVDHASDFGLKINYEPPDAVGIDRLVAASAAAAIYGAPCIVCDFGTAATIDAVSEAHEYLGGTITPGINTFSRALFQNTSKLPEIPVRKPEKVIGNSTIGSIESGIFYGYIGLVEGLLGRMKKEMPEARVIATGGYIDLIAENTSMIDFVDKDLMLRGLQITHSRS